MRFKNSLLFIIMALLLIVFTACNENSTSKNNNSNNNISSNETNNSDNTGSNLSLEGVRLGIATGNSGSAIYALGGGFKQAIEKHIPGSKVSVIGSAGYGENAVMLANKEADIGTTSMSAAQTALEGMLKDKPNLLNDLRILSTAHTTSVHAVVKADSDIQSISDLKGKAVSIGEPGSGTEATNRYIFEAYDMTYDDINAQYLSFNETTDAFQDGNLDAFIITTMHPNPNILSLMTQRDIRFLEFNQDDADAINAIYSSSFIPTEFPTGLYDNEEPIPTIGVPASYIVHKDMEDELAYELAKIMNEHGDEIERVHPAGAQWKIENALFGYEFPYHAGAVQYYKDVDVWDDRPEDAHEE